MLSVTRITTEGKAMSGTNLSPQPDNGIPARRRTRHLRETVADDIKQLILQQRLRPGDPLPTEAELCDAVGASRSSVREAVKTLAALDIVEVRHGHGTYVGGMSLAALVESLAFRGLLSQADDHLVLSELVEVRQTLEQGLADQIIAGLDDDHRSELSLLADGMRQKAADGKEFIELDREFHLMLMEPLGNNLILQLTGAFWDVHTIVAPSLETTSESLRVTAEHHCDIAAAAVAGDADALRTAIANHYEPIRASIAGARAQRGTASSEV
ncbi:GntR family transcriptional regulator [Nocardioides sp. CF8]|nr:GntR family transcriptional regulator [Nocardioides sp. CF8]